MSYFNIGHQCVSNEHKCGCREDSCTEGGDYCGTYHGQSSISWCYREDFCDIRGCMYPTEFKNSRTCCKDFKCQECSAAYLFYKKENEMKRKLDGWIKTIKGHEGRHSIDGKVILCDFCSKERCICLDEELSCSSSVEEKIKLCREFIKKNQKWFLFKKEPYLTYSSAPTPILCIFCKCNSSICNCTNY